MNRKKPLTLVLVTFLLVDSLIVQPALPALTDSDIATRKDAPQDFSAFLESCSQKERIDIARAARLLPKLRREDFGKYTLKPYAEYADSPKTATVDKPERPQSFNEVADEGVAAAIQDGRIPRARVCALRLQKELLWFSSHWIPYLGRDEENVDYHEIVSWVAKKDGVTEADRASASTFELERKICLQYMARLWDSLEGMVRRQVEAEPASKKLTHDQREQLIKKRTVKKRQELLDAIEKKTGASIENKAAIAAMGGAAAIAALSTTVALTGFAFYTTMSVVICTVAAWVGITVPFVVYTTASTVVAVLSGPVGLALATGAVITAAVLAGRPHLDTTRQMVMTIHAIKIEHLHRAASRL